MIRYRLTTIPILAALLLWTSLAMGQAAEPNDPEEDAKQQFIEASELFTNGQFAEAAAMFRQANATKPSWKLQYNIGQAESAAKRYGLALEAFELYLADGGDEIPEERNAEVLQEVKRLRAMVASVDVKAPEGWVVIVDDVERGRTPLMGVIKVTAGKRHQVEIVKDGEVIESRIIRLSGGDETVIEIDAIIDETPEVAPADDAQSSPEITPVPDSPAPVPEKGISAATRLKIAGGVLLGAGAATAAVGGVFGGLAISKANELADMCPQMVCSTPEAITTQDDSWTFGTLSNILVISGAAVGTAGLVMLIVGIHKGKSEQLTSMHLVPIASESFSCVILEGRF